MSISSSDSYTPLRSWGLEPGRPPSDLPGGPEINRPRGPPPGSSSRSVTNDASRQAVQLMSRGHGMAYTGHAGTPAHRDRPSLEPPGHAYWWGDGRPPYSLGYTSHHDHGWCQYRCTRDRV